MFKKILLTLVLLMITFVGTSAAEGSEEDALQLDIKNAATLEKNEETEDSITGYTDNIK